MSDHRAQKINVVSSVNCGQYTLVLSRRAGLIILEVIAHAPEAQA